MIASKRTIRRRKYRPGPAEAWDRNYHKANYCNCGHPWQMFEKRCPSCRRKR